MNLIGIIWRGATKHMVFKRKPKKQTTALAHVRKAARKLEAARAKVKHCAEHNHFIYDCKGCINANTERLGGQQTVQKDAQGQVPGSQITRLKTRRAVSSDV